MFNHTSYMSGLGKPALLTSPAILPKANSHQRMGTSVDPKWGSLFKQYQRACAKLNTYPHAREGGHILWRRKLTKEALAATQQLIKFIEAHPENEELNSKLSHYTTIQGTLSQGLDRYRTHLNSKSPLYRLGKWSTLPLVWLDQSALLRPKPPSRTSSKK
jgi:hypothetical protein